MIVKENNCEVNFWSLKLLYGDVTQSSLSDDIILEYPDLLKSRAGFQVTATYNATNLGHACSIGNIEQVCLYPYIAFVATTLSSL